MSPEAPKLGERKDVPNDFLLKKKVFSFSGLSLPVGHIARNMARRLPTGTSLDFMGVPSGGKSTLITQLKDQVFPHYEVEGVTNLYDDAYRDVCIKYEIPLYEDFPQDKLNDEQHTEVILHLYKRRQELKRNLPTGKKVFILTEHPGVGIRNRGQHFIKEAAEYYNAESNNFLFILVPPPDLLEKTKQFREFISKVSPSDYRNLQTIIYEQFGEFIPELEPTEESGAAYVLRILHSASSAEITRLVKEQRSIEEFILNFGETRQGFLRAQRAKQIYDQLAPVYSDPYLYPSVVLESVIKQLMYWDHWIEQQKRYDPTHIYRVLNI